MLPACGRVSVPTSPTVVASPPSNAPIGLRTYDLTFTLDAAACPGLPEQVRRRTYTTMLGPTTTLASLTGATFVSTTVPYPAWNVMYVKRTGAAADLWFQDPPLWEALSDDSYLVIYGDAHGEIGPDATTLPFWAKVEYCPEREVDTYPECEVAATKCESTKHQLTVQLRQ
jgi:hypothetical protein